jgi:hypothetical protein
LAEGRVATGPALDQIRAAAPVEVDPDNVVPELPIRVRAPSDQVPAFIPVHVVSASATIEVVVACETVDEVATLGSPDRVGLRSSAKSSASANPATPKISAIANPRSRVAAIVSEDIGLASVSTFSCDIAR